MNRKILFRGFSEEKQEWLYGDLINGLNAFLIRYYIDVPPTYSNPCADTKSIYEEVIPESIGQFIGLHDKDNSKIFEGDIVLWGKHPAVCIFDERCRWIFRNTLGDFDVFGYTSECKIIGNVFRNPELLEK